MAKKDKPAGRERPARRIAREGLFRGVGKRLLLVFLGVTMMTVLVAGVGYRGLADSRRTLEGAQESFGRVSELLGEATSSLGSTSSTIEAAGATLDSTITTVSDTSDRVNRLNTIDLPAVVAIGAIRQSLTAVAVGERTLLMRQLYDPRIRGQMRTAISTAFARADSAIAGISGISPRLDEKTRTAWRSFLESWREWIGIHESLMDEFDAIDDLLGQRLRGGFEFEEISKAAFDIAFGEGLAARETVDQRLDAVVALIRESAREGGLAASKEAAAAAAEAITAKDSMQNATAQLRTFRDGMVTVNDRVGETTGEMAASIENTRRVRVFFIICAAAGLVVSVLVALRQTRRLARPIRAAARQMDLLAKGEIDHNILSVYESRPDEIGALARSVGEMLDSLREEVAIAGDMAEGDFSGRVRLRGEKDKLGRALSAMMRITHDALTRVNRHVGQVTGGAESISRVSGALSTGATRTAEALVEISATMTQLGEQTHRNAENAMQANEFAIASQRVAERGYEAVEEMVSSMQDIQASGAQIARIVKLIDDIAFQTNLLALNAAVEAARAGRQGKGFSVVAGEVRNLASRSAKAARETAVLVEETVKRVENGVAIAGRTDGAFKEILANAERTTDLYGKIALASQEQSSGIDQVVQGVGRIDDLTQENSRYAVETADSARELSRQSGELRQMMVRFQLQEEGAAPGGAGEISLEGEAARRMIALSGRPEGAGRKLLM